MTLIIVPQPIATEELVKIKDILQALPLGTRRKLKAIRDSADYLIAEDALDGDTADLLLSIIEAGDAINVLSPRFQPMVDWLLGQPTLNVTQEDINKLTTGV